MLKDRIRQFEEILSKKEQQPVVFNGIEYMNVAGYLYSFVKYCDDVYYRAVRLSFLDGLDFFLFFSKLYRIEYWDEGKSQELWSKEYEIMKEVQRIVCECC